MEKRTRYEFVFASQKNPQPIIITEESGNPATAAFLLGKAIVRESGEVAESVLTEFIRLYLQALVAVGCDNSMRLSTCKQTRGLALGVKDLFDWAIQNPETRPRLTSSQIAIHYGLYGCNPDEPDSLRIVDENA